jgi:hypothetical protein
MGQFLDVYKRLDNLCKDIFHSDRGISTYIENLEHLRSYQYENDYRRLKEYRYIRNQIVHENNVDEEDMYDQDDIRWLEEFYERIMNQTDPLCLHNKNKRTKVSRIYMDSNINAQYQTPNKNQATKNPLIKAIVIVGISILAIYLFVFWITSLIR